MTDDLADFLLARIAEREADPWGDLEIRGSDRVVGQAERDALRADEQRWETFVRAECEANRRIVQLHERQPTGHCSTCTPVDHGWFDYEPDFAPWPCDTMKALALPYAAHPDYREEWRL